MLKWEPKNRDRSELRVYLERAPERPRGAWRKWVGQKSDFHFTFPTPLGKHVPHTFPTVLAQGKTQELKCSNGSLRIEIGVN
jgi:hypothetical protein